MQNTNILDKWSKFAKKSLPYQVLLSPVSSFKFFLLTRMANIVRKSIVWKAKTFWGGEIKGFFPEPVFSFIYLYGFLEEAVTKMLIKHLKPGMVFVDIGAHIGYFSLLASKIVGKEGKVFSFEPTPETYKLLLTNVSKLNNVITNNNALWSKTKIVDLFDYGEFNSGCNSFMGARMSDEILQKIKPNLFKISALKLDDYLAIFNVKPDFVKIDAESAEYDILVGMKNTLKGQKPVLAIEIGDKPEQKGRTQKIIRFLETLNYKTLEYKDGIFRRHEKLDNYFNLYENLLFIPK